MIRKSFIVLLVFCLFIVPVASATQLEGIREHIPEIIPKGDFDKYINENYSSSIGIEAILNIDLPVPRFSQHDPDWAEEIINGSEPAKTFSEEGCALCSVAMVFKYFDIDTDPLTLNNDLGTAAYPLDWYKAPKLGADGQLEVVTFRQYPSWNTIYSTCVSALEDETPVIVGFIKSGKKHFVVVKGVYGDGRSADDFELIDPNGGVIRTLDYFENRTPYEIIIYQPK
ncbi:C39 family peptidase [Thermoanaerobacterium sp. DL9XJH110]|uniref:C39 family peptidase n=1 Tax=Thermoanaerobacterium sp. DL9XJH110 TaxID=3386643 RepID=UPI003BB59730